jgi:Zn-dependent peptidase ImmA (M78 family)
VIFNPARLRIARKRRSLNKKDFAEEAGINQRTVVRCEKGQTYPTDENIDAFARVTRFPREFFFRPTVDEPDSERTSFRSLTSMTASIRDAALAAGAIGFEIAEWVEERFELPAVQLPDLSLYSDPPDVAARVLREEWALGEAPVSNMVQLLESKGVRVFSLAEDTSKVDAYSLWRNDKPHVFLNTFKSAERSRFDSAHELGHLVLHREGNAKGRTTEDEANAFASAFLMPESDLLAQVPRVDNLNQLIGAKSRWRVSLAALCYRLHKLGIISDWRYRDFCIDISTKGYNREEPSGIRREQSVVWHKVLTALWSEHTTHVDIAKALAIPEEELTGLLFGILNPEEQERPSGMQSLSIIDNE